MRIATIGAVALLAGLATPGGAQDSHAGHAGHGAPAPATPDPMAGMDHGASGMTGMAGMDHDAMTDMAPMPKSIARPSPGPAEAALQGFSDALQVGSRELAIEQLRPDAVIVEDGKEESREAYIGHHLGADMRFAKTVTAVLLAREVRSLGAGRTQIISRTRMMSNRSDKTIDTTVSETATMVRVDANWRIERIEWQNVGQ